MVNSIVMGGCSGINSLDVLNVHALAFRAIKFRFHSGHKIASKANPLTITAADGVGEMFIAFAYFCSHPVSFR